MWFRKKNTLPAPEDVLQRLLGLYSLLFCVQEGAYRDDAGRSSAQLDPSLLTSAERELIEASPPRQGEFLWRLEAMQALMWALGHIPDLPPYDAPASVDLLLGGNPASASGRSSLRPVPELQDARETAELWHWRSRTHQLIVSGQVFRPDPKMKAAGLLTFDDIVRRTAASAHQKGTIPFRIGEDFPARGKAYRDLTEEEWEEIRAVAFGRHFALNWLCGKASENVWDKTPTST